MGLLAVPVQQEFQLSNAQLGLLQGVAFAIAYALGGLPIARLLDGGHRVRIAAACVALWSIATMLCGIAGSFLALAAFRAATAVAEAGLPPAAFSIFSQAGDRRAVARMTSTFMLAPFIGGGLVLLLGGVLLKFATDSGLSLPGWSSPWRMVFLAVGLPGLLLALLLVAFAREPARPAAAAGARPPLPSLRAVLSAIFRQSQFLRLYYLGLTTFCVLIYSVIAWYPAFLVGRFGISAATAGGYAGIVYLVAGVLGTLGVRLLANAGREPSVVVLVRGYVFAALLMVPVIVALFLLDNLIASLALYAMYAALSAAIIASMAVPIQLSLGNAMQARGIAVFALLTSALAGSAGPLIVGLLSDRAGISLGAALAITCGGASTVASLLLFRAWRVASDRSGSISR